MFQRIAILILILAGNGAVAQTRPTSRPATAPAAKAPVIEPDMVGVWIVDLEIRKMKLPLLVQLYPDGRFTWRIRHQPGAPFNFGKMQAANGKYREELKDGFVNEGTYKIIDANTFEMDNNNGGHSVWKLKNTDPDKFQ